MYGYPSAVDAIWFGGSIGAADNFQVVGNCSALQLTANGGHGTTIYTGPVPLAPNGCTVRPSLYFLYHNFTLHWNSSKLQYVQDGHAWQGICYYDI